MNLSSFKRFSFSGGERHTILEPSAEGGGDPNRLVAHIRSSDDLMDLMLVTDVLKRCGTQPRELVLPYLPYARQDRATTQTSPFSLEVVAGMINSLGYEQVTIYEVHNQERTAPLIRNAVFVKATHAAVRFLDWLGWRPSDTVLLAPDKGAMARMLDVAVAVPQEMGMGRAYAEKERNPGNGHLKITGVHGDVAGKRVLVIDDICDGGATFNQLADYLFAQEGKAPKQLALFVAHGIFSKGFLTLRQRYDHIGTTNSFWRPSLPSYVDLGTERYDTFLPKVIKVDFESRGVDA